jgi:hypothetical protein
MTQWNGQVLADMLMEQRRRHAMSSRHRSALASTIRRWLTPKRMTEPARPPVAGLLATYRDLAERIANGLESGPVRPDAVRAVEQLMSDVCPRSDDLRRAVYLVESR